MRSAIPDWKLRTQKLRQQISDLWRKNRQLEHRILEIFSLKVYVEVAKLAVSSFKSLV